MSYVVIPPELVLPTQQLLKRRGYPSSEDQVLDLLVAIGLEVLRESPHLVHGLDENLVSGPFFETCGVEFPLNHPSVASMREILCVQLQFTIGLAGTIRLAAAAGATSLGLPVYLC